MFLTYRCLSQWKHDQDDYKFLLRGKGQCTRYGYSEKDICERYGIDLYELAQLKHVQHRKHRLCDYDKCCAVTSVSKSRGEKRKRAASLKLPNAYGYVRSIVNMQDFCYEAARLPIGGDDLQLIEPATRTASAQAVAEGKQDDSSTSLVSDSYEWFSMYAQRGRHMPKSFRLHFKYNIGKLPNLTKSSYYKVLSDGKLRGDRGSRLACNQVRTGTSRRYRNRT